MNSAYLLLGGNIGDSAYHLATAIKYIEKEVGIIINSSSIYETAAWGKTDEPNFLNQVILCHTELPSEILLRAILDIEKQMGRTRSIKNASRIIDIDILFFNQQVIASVGLSIPHPEISKRKFVLVPLAEIAGNYVHPVLGVTVQVLLENCVDPLTVNLWKKPLPKENL